MTTFITQTDVESYLGRTLTTAEDAQIDSLMDAACEYVESVCGRGFGTTGITDEPAKIICGKVYLGRPVSAVSTVKTISAYVGATATTLPSSQWSLWDAAHGVLLVSGYYTSDALISYTPAATVPESVVQAAVMLAASWLTPTSADSYQQQGIKSYSVGQELQITYADNATRTAAVPSTVTTLLAPYMRPVIV